MRKAMDGVKILFVFSGEIILLLDKVEKCMHYELELDYYKGPLDKLLELVEEKKLEITTVNLAEVTADFLKYVEALEAKGQRDIIADFLVVASRLILIKSKVLIPDLLLSEEEEADIVGLETRLKLYQELKTTQAYIKSMWSLRPQMADREFLQSKKAFFLPPENISTDMLQVAMHKVLGELEKVIRPVEIVKREIIHLKHKIQEIIDRISEIPFSFREFHKNRSKGEIVVLFLAILHLIKDQVVSAEQGNHFEDIVVAKLGKNQ
jgi:segregation and condensation protein A